MAPFFMSENFIAYLKIEKRFSDHTCVAYKNDVNQFFEHFTIAGLDELKGVDNKMIRNWMVHLIDEGLKGVTVNRKLSSLRTYFNWLLKEGELEISPAKSVKGPKTEKRLPVFAQQQELRSLDEIFSNDFEGVRDELIFELLYQTGIRTSELIGLKDIDVSNLSIKVLGKRSKERIIPINEKLLQRTQNNVSQTKKSRFQRWDNVSSSFEIKDLKTYKHILIVDDVATTGATIEHIIILLKEKAPDLKISVVTLAIA